MLWRTATALCALTLLAGCTSGTPDDDEPPPATTAAHYPRYDVPTVDDPLDAGPLATDPCPSLTAAEQADLGVGNPIRTEVADGVSCAYGSDFLGLTVFFSNRPSGLSFLYGMHDEGAWGHWHPTEIDGYPAVEYDPAERTENCSLAVGLSDTTYFSVTASASPGAEFCVRSTTVAGMVLDAVRAA